MKIYVNQMGYLPKSIKTARLTQAGDKDAAIPAFSGKVQICTKDGGCVLEKEAVYFGWDESSGDFVWQVDFSEVEAIGTYEIKWQDQTSYPFQIGEELYDNLNVCNMLTKKIKHLLQELLELGNIHP